MEENQERVMNNLKSEKLAWRKQIASGGYGVVFEGLYNGQKVAVKVMIPGDMDGYASAMAEAFQREVSLWTQLDHPNVAKFIGAAKEMKSPKLKRSGCCVVSEYLRGGTLASYVTRRKKLAFSDKMKLGLDVAKGLCYLHSKKIVHRDLKLENLLLDDQRRVKIIDFGISRTEAAEMSFNVGSKGYIAPEVMIPGHYDHRCDVFSFGICLWEIYYQKRFQICLSTTPRIGDDCPEDLANLMRHCWEEPKRRPEMDQVVQILEEILRKAEEDMDSQRGNQTCCFGFRRR